MSHNAPRAPDSGDDPDPAGAHGEAEDESARIYYERLLQTGQLAEVDFGTDLAALSPRITHVRYPDGRIERVGFS